MLAFGSRFYIWSLKPENSIFAYVILGKSWVNSICKVMHKYTKQREGY